MIDAPHGIGAGARYLDRLATRVRATGTSLCLGIDPDPDALPDAFPRGLRGLERFSMLLLETCGPYASAVKPNLAFFESFGSAGLAVLERLRAAVPADLPVVLDAKRADVASTSRRHATALFEHLAADAVTVNPYLGREALEPLLGFSDRFVYVLCRTSNPGAAEFQGLLVTEPGGDGHEPLYERVARSATTWGADGRVGLVVGATAPAELERVRAIAPDLPFLVPGVGAQEGDVAAVLRDGPARRGAAREVPGGALLVNVSRAIAATALGASRPGRALEQAARDWSSRLEVLR